METKYDAIIIGSDISGLISAALLAGKGVRVAIVSGNEGPAVYDRKGYTFSERPFPITGLNGGPLGMVFDEIGLSREAFRKDRVSYQVVLPDERIDIYEDQGLFDDEMRRCFPDENDRISAFYCDISGMNSKAGQVIDLNPFSLRLLQPSGIRKWRRSVDDLLKGYGLSERFRLFIKAQLTPFSYSGSVSTLAASSILGSLRKGIYYIEGGSDGLKGRLLKKIKSLGGDIVESSVREVSRNGNRWLLRTGNEAFSARAVIGNIDLQAFCGLFLNEKGSYFKKAKRVHKSLSPVTVNLGIKDTGVPVGMADNVVMVREYGKESALDNLLFFQISPSVDGNRIMSVTSNMPTDDYSRKERVWETAENMLQGVEHLCPFIERYAEVLDIRYSEPRGGGTYSTSLREKMAVGLMPHEMVRGEVFFAGPEVFPSLGFDGLVYSGRVAAAAILKRFEKDKA